MMIKIKLFGGIICRNQSLQHDGLKSFRLEVQKGSTLGEIHEMLGLSPSRGLVNIVDGHAQPFDYIINEDCNISIFPPMSDKQHDLFEKI